MCHTKFNRGVGGVLDISAPTVGELGEELKTSGGEKIQIGSPACSKHLCVCCICGIVGMTQSFGPVSVPTLPQAQPLNMMSGSDKQVRNGSNA